MPDAGGPAKPQQWDYFRFSQLSSWPPHLRRRLERAIGTDAAARAVGQCLAGCDPSERTRPLLVPLFDVEGYPVSAVRCGFSDDVEPVRLSNADVDLPDGVPLWMCNFPGGVGDALDNARGKALHLTLSPLHVLHFDEFEPAVGLTGRQSADELVAWIAALVDWRRPSEVVCHFAATQYPAQIEALSALDVEVRWVKSALDREDDAKERAASESAFYVLPKGQAVFWGPDGWTEVTKGAIPNVLTRKGWTLIEIKAAVPHFPLALGYIFEPKTTERVVLRGGEVYLNRYRGMPPLVASEGPWGLIEQVLLHLCDGDVAGYEYVLDWFAAPLQSLHRGLGSGRNLSALVFHGAPGAGKGWLEEVFAGLYGPYKLKISNEALTDRFEPGRFASCLFLIANEVIAQDTRAGEAVAARLKGWVTDRSIPVREMNIAGDEMLVHFNMVFFSNAEDPVRVERGDRRYSVFWQARELASGLVTALREEQARGWPSLPGFLHALLTRHVTQPLWKPYENEARASLMALSADSVEAFVETLYREGLKALARPWVVQSMAKARAAGQSAVDAELSAGHFVHLTTLREVYALWCGSMGYPTVRLKSMPSVRASVKRKMPWLREAFGRVGGRFGRGLLGVPLVPEDRLRVLTGDFDDGGALDAEASAEIIDLAARRPA